MVFFDIDIAFVGDPSWDPARAGMPPGTADRNTLDPVAARPTALALHSIDKDFAMVTAPRATAQPPRASICTAIPAACQPRPCAAMAVPVGNEQSQEDPTVNELCAMTARCWARSGDFPALRHDVQ